VRGAKRSLHGFPALQECARYGNIKCRIVNRLRACAYTVDDYTLHYGWELLRSYHGMIGFVARDLVDSLTSRRIHMAAGGG